MERILSFKISQKSNLFGDLKEIFWISKIPFHQNGKRTIKLVSKDMLILSIHITYKTLACYFNFFRRKGGIVIVTIIF